MYERAIFATPDGKHLVGSPLTLSVELGSDNRVVHAACWDGDGPPAGH